MKLPRARSFKMYEILRVLKNILKISNLILETEKNSRNTL
jgi:hypothetical protein